MPNKPTDHAVTRGRDVRFRYVGGHSPEYHTVVLEWCWKPPTDRSGKELLRPVLTVSTTCCCKLHDQRSPSTYREPTITKGAMQSSGVGGSRRGIQQAFNYHKVSLVRNRNRASGEREITDGITAKESVVKRRERSNTGTRTARRTTKIWSIVEKNREEQSQRQAEEQSQRQAEEQSQRQAKEQSQQQAREEHSQRQAKQTKGLRDKAK